MRSFCLILFGFFLILILLRLFAHVRATLAHENSVFTRRSQRACACTVFVRFRAEAPCIAPQPCMDHFDHIIVFVESLSPHQVRGLFGLSGRLTVASETSETDTQRTDEPSVQPSKALQSNERKRLVFDFVDRRLREQAADLNQKHAPPPSWIYTNRKALSPMSFDLADACLISLAGFFFMT